VARRFGDPGRRPPRGFTLIEILVVMSLLAVLMGLSVGFIAIAGSGNKLLLTTNALAGQFAAARAQSYGNNTAYVVVQTKADGRTVLRTFRDRQQLAWPAEDFARASQEVIQRAGGVEISTDLGLEGHYALFSAGGTIDLGDRPWLDFRDGFAIDCRLRAAGRAGPLFRKGDVLSVSVVTGTAGRLGIEAKIRLERDEQGQGDGWYDVRSGTRDAEVVPEWTAPLLPGRWHDVRVSYDRNTFAIHVDGRLCAIRTDRKNTMHRNDDHFVIGGGYEGGFDSFVISGIFEDDQDRFDVPAEVKRIGPDGKPAAGNLMVHFRNRTLDPQHHAGPVQIWFELDEGPNKAGAKRVVTVALSGETFVRRPEELK
jgi:prepilin-type N-terminal cleavage/methylation domain-containing protein